MNELCLNKQDIFMENYFSKFQCDFRKGYSLQQCLIALIEKWKSATDKGEPFGA